jgi:hypothetical protein
MVALEPCLYLTVSQLDATSSPLPLPLDSGFSEGVAYRALGLFSPSETSEAYFILSNDRDEVWFISNRHLRTHGLLPEAHALRLPLAALPVNGQGTPAHDPDDAPR